MASILNIKGRWRAQVRRKGHDPITQTFSTKKLAQTWAAKVEAELEERRAGLGTEPGRKVGAKLDAIFTRAMQDSTAGRTKLNVLQHLSEGLGALLLDSLTAQDIVQYVEHRGYSPATAQQEMSILGTTLQLAEHAWGFYVPPVMKQARTALKLMNRISKSRERDRRPTADELQRLGEWFDQHSTLPMKDLMWFSVHTAMRASEVTGLRWSDYNARDKTIIVRDRKDPKNKKGNHQEVPLLDAAIEIIERQPRTIDPSTKDFIFPYNHRTFSSLFPRARKKLGIDDLRWHDLRHEGASRLFEMGYDIPEVALFTGHKDWRQLKRYTHLKAKDLRRLRLPVVDALQEPSTHAGVLPPVSLPVGALPAGERGLCDKLAPGMAVEFVDNRARRHERRQGLIVGVSQSKPRRYTVRIDEGTKYEHTRKLWAAQILAVCLEQGEEHRVPPAPVWR